MTDGKIGEVVQPNDCGGPVGPEGPLAGAPTSGHRRADRGDDTHLAEGLSSAKRALLEARRRRALRTPADVPGEGPPVLSSAQERVWLLDQVEGGTAAYNAPRAIRVRGPLDVAALRQALDEIVRRHAVLRTVVELVDGAPAA